jgi:hypothetical protein
MEVSQIYILGSIIVLIIIAILMIFLKKKDKKRQLTPLSGLAFAFVISGIAFGSNRWVGYGLIGIGVVLAMIDILIKMKAQNKK